MTIDDDEFLSGRITSDGHGPFNVVAALPEEPHLFRIEIFDPDNFGKVFASGEARLPKGRDLWIAIRLWSNKLTGPILEPVPNPNPKPKLEIRVGDTKWNNYFF